MVSVVMASFNQLAFIAGAIDSVLRQSVSAWELLIVDAGSSDGSREVVDRYCREYPLRIRLVRPAGSSIIDVYGAGIGAAAGEFIAFLEADDEWEPSNLQEKLALFERFPGCGVVYSDMELTGDPAIVREKTSYMEMVRQAPRETPLDMSARILYCNPIPGFSAALVRRGLLTGLRLPQKTLDQYWLDWHIWNFLAFRTGFCFLPRRLVKWRHHPGSATRRLRQSRGFLGFKWLEMRQRLGFLFRALSAGDIGFTRKMGLAGGFMGGLALTALRYAGMKFPLQPAQKRV